MDLSAVNNKLIVEPVGSHVYLKDKDIAVEGIVISTGSGYWENGTFIKMSYNIGDKVIYKYSSGINYNYKDQSFVILTNDDILATFKDKKSHD